MTFSWTPNDHGDLVMVQSSVSFIYLPCDFFSPSCSLTLPYLCKYFDLYCLKGDILERHQNHGLTFFVVVETSAVLNSILPLYKILQGVSPQMQYFGLVSFLFKNNLCETGSVCVCVCVCERAWVLIR